MTIYFKLFLLQLLQNFFAELQIRQNVRDPAFDLVLEEDQYGKLSGELGMDFWEQNRWQLRSVGESTKIPTAIFPLRNTTTIRERKPPNALASR